ncbi:MAG: class I SAM-dependent methyltransferase [Burkholderiales bacterium]
MTAGMASNAGYDVDAAALAAQYESIAFEHVHRSVRHLFPQPPSTILDIGAGSGRDAAALSRLGHHVTAVEPTCELRCEGQRLHAAAQIDWLDDRLPELSIVRRLDKRFDLILLTAVWMHLNRSERVAAMVTVAQLLAEGGLVSMSLRHGPFPVGRRMFAVSADETIELGARCGLNCLQRTEQDDAQGRADVCWTFVVLRKPGARAAELPNAGATISAPR